MPEGDEATEALENLLELRYRREFHLSAAEMQQEPIYWVNFMKVVWKAEARKQRIEEKRQEQQSKLRNH